MCDSIIIIMHIHTITSGTYTSGWHDDDVGWSNARAGGDSRKPGYEAIHDVMQQTNFPGETADSAAELQPSRGK